MSPTTITGIPDVRDILLRDRRTVIVRRHGARAPGEAFELRNEPDARALNHQFEAEHRGEYTWEFREKGPTIWRVSIGRP